MKNTFFLGVMAVVISTLMLACTGTFTIFSDYDHEADFSKYKTFNYLPGGDSLMGPGGSRLKSFTEEYLKALGYEKSDSPDLFITINGKVQQRFGTTSNNAGYNGRYGGGYYGGYYGGYSGWDNYSTTYVYNQTTIMIDMIDVKAHKMVWQGGATGEFDQYSLKDSRMQKMIDEIFGRYPYSAGSNSKRALLYGKYYKKPEPK